MNILDGKTIVVTGAARGIGAAIAKACAKHGSKVVLIDKLQDELTALAKSLMSQGLNVEYYACDLCDSHAVEQLFKRDLGQLDSIDGLVNNAGTTVYGTSSSTSLEDLMRIFNIHLAPTLLCTQAVLPMMTKAGKGSIVHMASAAAQAAVTRLFGYSMAKSAIVSMTQHMASEYATHGIRVNALAPGPVMTEALRSNQDAKVQQMLCSGIPMDRFAEPYEVAEVAAFLMSDMASYVNGHVLNVDGGLMALKTPLHQV